MRRCARALIVNEEGKLLVFERNRRTAFGKNLHYFSIPGGGIEEDETPEQAVVRELSEEMCVTIQAQQLVLHQTDALDQRENFYFTARIVEGVPTFNLESEEAQKKHFLPNSYRVAWVNLDEPALNFHKGYGQVANYLRTWISTGVFPSKVIDIHVENE